MKHEQTDDHGHAHQHAEGEGGHGHHVKHTPEEWAKKLDNPERDGWQKPGEVVKALQIVPGQTVADIGAGTGYFLKYLSEAVGANGKVLALDVEADLVAHMTERSKKEKLGNVQAIQCPFDGPGLDPSSVDRILIVNTWHHFSNRVAYAKKLLTALKPDGALFIVDFNKDSEVGPPKEAKLTSDQVVAELEKAGFTSKLVKESLPEQYIIRATEP